MNLTTTRRATPTSKPFAWSYSKLKNYETCPKRHYHVDLKKDFREAESEQLLWGNRVHKMMAEAIAGTAPLPDVHAADLGPWIDRVFDWKGKDVRAIPGLQIKVEQQLAITKDFAKTEWFGKDAWYRAVVDVMWIAGPLGFAGDWKTGKIVEDSVQLILTAACMFYHYPELQIVRSMFAWIKEDADTTLDIRREELPKIWADLWSRIEQLQQAHMTQDYPPSPSFLCRRWCPVTTCPNHGKDFR